MTALHIEIGFAIRRRVADAMNNERHPAFPALLILSNWAMNRMTHELMVYLNDAGSSGSFPSFHGVPLFVDRRDARDYWTLYTNAGWEQDGQALDRIFGIRAIVSGGGRVPHLITREGPPLGRETSRSFRTR